MMLTDAEWRAFQDIPEQGHSHRAWVDERIRERVARAVEKDVAAAIHDLLPAECWVLRSDAGPRCTDMIGGGFPNGAKWTEDMCCLPCRIRDVLREGDGAS